jgi:membrane protein YqaA with SNARE-associated domain
MSIHFCNRWSIFLSWSFALWASNVFKGCLFGLITSWLSGYLGQLPLWMYYATWGSVSVLGVITMWQLRAVRITFHDMHRPQASRRRHQDKGLQNDLSREFGTHMVFIGWVNTLNGFLQVLAKGRASLIEYSNLRGFVVGWWMARQQRETDISPWRFAFG